MVNLPNKKLGVEFDGRYLIFKMKNMDVEENIKMNLESAALLKILMEKSALVAEKLNKDFKKNNIKIYEIQDIGTVFGVDGRISIGVLPADEKRIATILVGFHKDEYDRHVSVVVKPKKIALFSVIISKIISENLNYNSIKN